MPKFKIKVGDNVIVTTGSNKGATGAITKVIKDKQRVVIEGVNKIKKHVKPSAQNPQGGIVEVEAPLHISNVALKDPKSGDATKIGINILEDGTKQRIAKKSGQVV